MPCLELGALTHHCMHRMSSMGVVKVLLQLNYSLLWIANGREGPLTTISKQSTQLSNLILVLP